MKNNYLIFVKIAMMIAALSFTACGGDDEDDVIEGGGNNSTPSIGKKLVRAACESYIDYKSDMYRDEYYVSYFTFTYDDKGRIIQIVVGDETINVVYDELFTIVNGNSIHIQHTLYNGRIVESEGSFGFSVKNLFKDDYLIERSYLGSYEKYFWNDGNMVKIERDYGDRYGEIIIEYSKYNDVNGLFSSFIPEESGGAALLSIGTIGYLGKCSKNLPLNSTSTDYHPNGNVRTRIENNYEWEVENNLPIKLTLNSETHGAVNDFKNKDTYIFEWE